MSFLLAIKTSFDAYVNIVGGDPQAVKARTRYEQVVIKI